MKKSISIILACVLIMALALSVSASSGSKTAELFYRDIKITLNGQQITPKDANGNIVEPFIIDGTTYLPVRGVSGVLGLDVEWDGETSTVKLSEPGYAESSSYHRQNPAPIGTAQTFTYSGLTESYTATVKVNSVLRGEDAANKIKEATYFTTYNLDDDFEYLVANVTVSLISSKDDMAITFSRSSFTAFSESNVEYDHVWASLVSAPEELSGSMYAGATNTGNIVFAIRKSDNNPKAVIGDDWSGKGGAWFSLT